MQTMTPLQAYFATHAGPSDFTLDNDENASQKLRLAIHECSFQMRNVTTISDKLDELRKLAAVPASEEEAPLKMRALLKFSKRYLPFPDWKVLAGYIIVTACDEAFGQARLWH